MRGGGGGGGNEAGLRSCMFAMAMQRECTSATTTTTTPAAPTTHSSLLRCIQLPADPLTPPCVCACVCGVCARSTSSAHAWASPPGSLPPRADFWKSMREPPPRSSPALRSSGGGGGRANGGFRAATLGGCLGRKCGRQARAWGSVWEREMLRGAARHEWHWLIQFRCMQWRCV